MARGDADDASDVDLLVSLPPDKTGLALGALLMDVQDLLQRRVDVVTDKSLHPALRGARTERGTADMKPESCKWIRNRCEY